MMNSSMDCDRYVPGIWLRACNYFLWFVAGSFFGYIWMANAYGLIG
jgi:hypothetical protein